MSGVFVSYRRQDSEHLSGRIADLLRRELGRSRVFFDRHRDVIPPGSHWADVIESRLRASGLVIAVIGHNWTGVDESNPTGRIQRDGDWVRREIEIALDLGTPVIPVLIDGTPYPNGLPDSLEPLAQRQRYELRNDYFDRDVDELVRTIDQLLDDDRTTTRKLLDAAHRFLRPAAYLAAAALISVGTVAFLIRPDPPEMMDGAFNIAVARLDTSALTEDDQLDEDVGASIGSAVASALRREFDDETLVWGPGRVEPIESGDGATQDEAAVAVAAQQAADIVIYGAMTPAAGPSVEVALGLYVQSADERRPASPIVFDRIIGASSIVDPKRVDSADDALADFPQLRLMRPIVEALQALDDDNPDAALVTLDVLSTGDDLSGHDDAALRLTIEALRGVVRLRKAEFSDEVGHVALALGDLRGVLDEEPDFPFAEVWMLAGTYLHALGPTRASAADLESIDMAALDDVSSDLAAFIGEHRADQDALNVLQARNLAAQINLIRYDVDPSEEAALSAARTEFLAIDDALDDPPAGHRSPELELIVMAARSSLGLVADLVGDHEAALTWHEGALELATPANQAIEMAKIGFALQNLGRGCEARDAYEWALDRTADDGEPHLTGTGRSQVERERAKLATLDC